MTHALTRLAGCALALLLAAACAGQAPRSQEAVSLAAADPDTVQELVRSVARQDTAALAQAAQESLTYLERPAAATTPLSVAGQRLSPALLAHSLRELLEIAPRLASEPQLLAERFAWYRLDILLTGYYEPVLQASLQPGPGYSCPIYSLPPDLKTLNLGQFNSKWQGERLTYRLEGEAVRPYPDREAIDRQQALAGKGLEIAWAKDPVDVFGLQVQGSGLLQLPDGSLRQVLYAGQNGRPYVSLGKVMADRGLINLKDVTWPRMREVLAEHPQMVPELLDQNPSYVFFSLGPTQNPGEAPAGPLGSMGRPLTPLRSVAVDRSVIPLGGLLALEGEVPGQDGDTRPLTTLALAQDTGGAIKGRRADLFCGRGPEAEFLAGNLKHHFRLYVLLSKEALGGSAP